MNTLIKEKSNLKNKELINVSIIWTVLSLISALPYVESGFLVALVLFMSPLFIYWAIIWKYGPGSIMKYLSNLEFMKAIYSFINKVIKIDNLESAIIDGSAVKKERLLIFSIVVLLIAISMLSPLPIDIKMGVIVVYAPLLYVSFKGYRLAIITLIAIKTLDMIGFLLTNNNIISGFLWLAILSSIYIYALHVEGLRTELEAAGKKEIEKRHHKRDTIVAISLYFVLFFLMIIVSIGILASAQQ